MYTILINKTKFAIKADSVRDAKMKLCKILDIDIGELNNMNPEIFES